MSLRKVTSIDGSVYPKEGLSEEEVYSAVCPEQRFARRRAHNSKFYNDLTQSDMGNFLKTIVF